MLSFKSDSFPTKDHYLKCSCHTECPRWGILLWKADTVWKEGFLCCCTHRFGNLGGAAYFLTLYPPTCLTARFKWQTWSAPLTKHTGDAMARAGGRRGPYHKAGKGSDGFLLAPATQSEVSGPDQNSPVVLFLLLREEIECQSGWGGFLQVQRCQLELRLDFML